MKTMKHLSPFFLSALVLAGFASCDEKNDVILDENESYVLSLGVTANNATSYYVVTTSDLMAGTISPLNNGLEQTGYRDFQQGGQTIFSIGGMGVTNVNAITRGEDGALEQNGDFVFDKTLSDFIQLDTETMLGIEVPSGPTSGDMLKFYVVNIDDVSITKSVSSPVSNLTRLDWPGITGMSLSNNKLYVTYYLSNPSTWETIYTDTTMVAVYSYPDLIFEKVIKDTRTGPAGSWNAYNGLLKTENNDLYIMSNSAISNGYSQSTKNAAFLRIPSGTTAFDTYHFDVESKTNGLKPAHIRYIGDGLVFAEISTLNPQTQADRWGDKSLKSCIIDLNKQTVTDVTGIPVHDGNGGRRFTAFVEAGVVYYPISTAEGLHVYKINPKTATAVKGAEIQATFVGGLFRLN